MGRLVVLIGLCGCDALFGLHRAPDAAIDSEPDASDRTRVIGCSDGTREVFDDAAAHPAIAGCDGAWTVEGLDAPGRAGTATALCAIGWHICSGAAEVVTAGGACAALVSSRVFYATNQPSNGNAACSGNGLNDIFGCGRDLGDALAGCPPLDRYLRLTGGQLAPWNLGTDEFIERHSVVKGAGGGGVLCCRD